VELGEDRVLVRDEVDDAVRDHDVEARVLERQPLRFAFHELDVGRSHLGCGSAGLREHLRRHVDSGDAPAGADHLGGDERVGCRAGAETSISTSTVTTLSLSVGRCDGSENRPRLPGGGGDGDPAGGGEAGNDNDRRAG
jgi:hypothetical protein